MEQLKVMIRNVKGDVKPDEFNILFPDLTDGFSAKRFKEETRQTIFKAIKLKSNQRTFSNGSRVEISASHENKTVKLRPTYLGGGRGVKEIANQLDLFVRS
jgi:hypothetical protein